MADVFTGASTDAGTGQLSNQVLTAYDRVAWFALREQAIFDTFAKTKPGNLTSPGSPVTITFLDDLAAATTPLNEITDIEVVGLSDSQVSITPAEYGNGVILSIRIRKDDFLVGFDADVANLLAFNMVDTIDTLARTALDGGTSVTTVAASEGATVATDVITAALVRQMAATMRGASVVPLMGTFNAAVIHPDVSYDLRNETGDGAWVTPAQYVDVQRIYSNELGSFGGFRFIESPRAKLNADGGSTTVDTYTTYFIGSEALGKVETIPPHMVLGPVVDRLKRLQPLGWHVYAGWDTLREDAIQRLISASSIGANT